MKKHLIAALIAVVMCLTVLSGCSLMGSFEKDVTVVAKDGANVLKTGVVNTFNSMIMPTNKADGQSLEDSAEQGYYFAGWSTVENWKEGAEGCEESQFFGKEYITYSDVKDFATDGSVVLYPAYKIKINYFFVFGYYAWTSTSGLDEATMQPVAEALEAYLNENYSAEISTFVESDPEHNKVFDMRGYNPGGNSIGGASAMVNKDGDVSIFFGGAQNMSDPGNLYCYALTKNDGDCIHIGGKTKRVAGLLKNDGVSIAVFNWFQNYVKENIDDAFTVTEVTAENLKLPEEKPEVPGETETPTTQSGIKYTIGAEDTLTFKIGCYGKSDTSGITAEIKEQFENGLKAALQKCGASEDQLANVEVKFYCFNTTPNNVKALNDAIEADVQQGGNMVDILLGGKSFTAEQGTYVNQYIKDTSADMRIGAKGDRRVIRFNNKGLTLAVYNWILSTEGLALLKTPTAA